MLLTAGFYASVAAQVPGLDVNSRAFRSAVSPLNAPAAGTDPAIVAAAHVASVDVFHVAMLVVAAMLVLGAAVNWFGISDAQALGTAPLVAAHGEGARLET